MKVILENCLQMLRRITMTTLRQWCYWGRILKVTRWVISSSDKNFNTLICKCTILLKLNLFIALVQHIKKNLCKMQNFSMIFFFKICPVIPLEIIIDIYLEVSPSNASYNPSEIPVEYLPGVFIKFSMGLLKNFHQGFSGNSSEDYSRKNLMENFAYGLFLWNSSESRQGFASLIILDVPKGLL